MMKMMKKGIALLLLVSLLTVLSACSDVSLTGTAADLNLDADEDISEDAGEPVAKVVIGGTETLYTSMTEAWSAVNASVSEDSEMILLTDWVAENGSFGSGDGFGETGNLTPKDRKKESIRLTIDLNGHTLDRNLQEPVKSGNIISLKKDGVFTIKNGTLTGGNTADRGGAVWIDNNETEVYLENLTITGNYAKGTGGAVFCKDARNEVYITDCTITGNVSEDYGGGVYLQGNFQASNTTTMHLSGIVVIKNNVGKDWRNNLCVQNVNDIWVWNSRTVYIEYVLDLEAGSEIYASVSDISTTGLVYDSEPGDGLAKVAEYFYSDIQYLRTAYKKSDDTEILYFD